MEFTKVNEQSIGFCDVILKVDHLKVWTPEEKSWWRRKHVKPRTLILNNVTDCIRSGEFLVILGPSGAGKTTYLISLGGKCKLPSEGAVTVNGENVRDMPPGAVEILPQFDVFMDCLSVKEHLMFMTEMKIGSAKNAASTVLKSITSLLKLDVHENSLIQSLSGGERRLLSLATALLSNPQILICDEPTTGLDSYNASLVIGLLKGLAGDGKIIICSVHQPSSDLFKEFNTIALMSEGRLLYHGTHDDCQQFFVSLNLRCPKNYNPAEFYIKAVSPSACDDENHVGRIMENNHNRFEACYETNTTPARFPPCKRNWAKQVQLLLWRYSICLRRNLKCFAVSLILSTVIGALVIGTCFAGSTGTTQMGVQNMKGFLWLVCSELSFNVSYAALYAFETEVSLFKKEVGMYRVTAYFVAKLLSEIPRCIIWPIPFIAITASAVELPNHPVTVLEFYIALMISGVASTAYGLGMGALFISTGIMGDVMPCADLPLFLMSGAFLRISSLPFWLYPVKFISHFYYTMDAVSNIYWRQIGEIECPSNITTNCLKDGAAVLIEAGYSSNFVLEDSLGLMFVATVWSILGYCGLKREERKGYAY